MKISPIGSTVSKNSFKGQYARNINEESLKQNSLWHKNSSVEKTLDSFHFDKKYVAYFADPLEPISDKVKETVDYVVYDNEPSYPDVNKEVSKNYFGTQRKNYRNDFEEVREYYYRREMGGHADVAEAKYQQWQAAECTRLYDKAGDLRYQKEMAEDNLKSLEKQKAQVLEDIRVAEEEINAQKNLKVNIEKHISDLEKLEKPYAILNNLAKNGSENEESMYEVANKRIQAKKTAALEYHKYLGTTETYKDIVDVENSVYKISKKKNIFQKEFEKLQKTIEKFKPIQENCKETIKNMQLYVDKSRNNITDIEKNIAEKKSLVEDCKAKLIPLFDELKNFYAKQGIKVIKKG